MSRNTLYLQAHDQLDNGEYNDQDEIEYLDNLARQLNEKARDSKRLVDLENLIHVVRRLVSLSENHSKTPALISHLGLCLYKKYQTTGEITDLQDAIEVSRRAISATDSSSPEHYKRIFCLALELRDRYYHSESVTDLDEAISILRSIVKSTSDDRRFSAECAKHLVVVLVDRYQMFGMDHDVQEAYEILQTTVAHTSDSESDNPVLLDRIAIIYESKSSKSRAEEDFAKGVYYRKKTLDATADADKPWRLKMLAERLFEAYLSTENVIELKESIELNKEALVLAPAPGLLRSEIIEYLLTSLLLYYQKTQDINALDEYTNMQEEVLSSLTEGGANRLAEMDFLCACYLNKFVQTKSLSSLKDAIKLAKQSLAITSDGDSQQKERMVCLENLLMAYFSETDEMDSLEECIMYKRRILAMGTDSQAEREERLMNLSVTLSTRFGTTGDIATLEEAIKLGTEVITINSRNDISKPEWLKRQSFNILARYNEIGYVDDLDKAFFLSKRALEFASSESSELPDIQARLAAIILERYNLSNDPGDLKEAIQLSRRAMLLMDENALYAAEIPRTLVRSLSETGSAEDLEEGIDIMRKIIAKSERIHNEDFGLLGLLMSKKFDMYGTLCDLDEAISIVQQLLEMTSEVDARRTNYFFSLGLWSEYKFQKTQAQSDADNAFSAYEMALNQSNGDIPQRIKAGAKAVNITVDVIKGLRVGRAAIELIPKLALRCVKHSDKQLMLHQVSGLAIDTAAFALQAGKILSSSNPSFIDRSDASEQGELTSVSIWALHAITLLEQGRGIFLSLLEDTRLDIGDLGNKNIELAKEVARVCNELGAEMVPGIMMTDENDFLNWSSQSDRRYGAGKAFDDLVLEIRKQPGFEYFAGPLRGDQIMDAAKHGPVVIFNFSSHGFDAILIERDNVQVLYLEPDVFPDDFPDDFREMKYGSIRVLEWLWDNITGPILDALGFTGPPDGDSWPHIWWIPTGLGRDLPLHVSGRHRAGCSETVMDRVVSSYASSIRSLLNSRRQCHVASTSPCALFVAMENTPGCTHLPSATKEVSILKELFNSASLGYIEPGCSKEEIIPHLKKCDIFHFAGHGKTNNLDPLKSSLFLDDINDPLTVSDLFEINIRESSPFLAYLSACGTARMESKALVDESIHLISACQLAGFRHVIGTMWEVNDEYCVDIAQITYETMISGSMSDESVARGLHAATKSLRDRWLNDISTDSKDTIHESGKYMEASFLRTKEENGMDVRDGQERNIVLLEDNEGGEGDMRLLSWVPYVHYGV